MYSVSWGAVRRRTGQSLSVLVLATIAAAAAASGPWYGLTVASRAAGAEVAARPPAQRVVNVHHAGVDTAGDPRRALDAFSATVQGMLPLAGAVPILGLEAGTIYTDRAHGNAAAGMPLAYRDGFCANVRLTGACPDRADTVAISADVARRLNLKPGDTLEVRPENATEPLRLPVAGVYETTDGTYWTDKLFQIGRASCRERV